MARKFEFSIVANFRDRASSGLQRFSRQLQRGFGAGALGGLQRAFGAGPMTAFTRRIAARPEGVGGMLSSLVQGAGGLITMPMRIVSAFSQLIPGVGGILSGVVGTASNILGGLVGVVGNIVGHMANAFSAVVRGFVRIAERVVSGVAGVLNRLVKVAAGVAAGAAAAFALLWRQTARAGDEIAKMARRTGLGVQWLSEMQHVLALTDATLGDVQQAMRGLGRAVEGAARGSRQYVETFQRLGVQIHDVRGQLKPTQRLFEEILVALGRIQHQQLRAGMAQRVFGRGAERLLPLIGEAHRLEAMREEARRFGLTWSPEDARAAERAADALARVRGAARGIREAFMRPMLEPFSRALERLADFLSETIRPRVEEFGQRAAAVFENVARTVERRVGGALEWITERNWSFANFREAFQVAFDGITAAIRRLPAIVNSVLPRIVTIAQTGIGEVFTYIMDGIDGAVRHLHGLLHQHLGALAGMLEQAGAARIQAIPRLVEEPGFLGWIARSWEQLGGQVDRAAPGHAAETRLGELLMWGGRLAGAGQVGFADLAAGAEERMEARKAEREALREIRQAALAEAAAQTAEGREDVLTELVNMVQHLSAVFLDQDRELQALRRQLKRISTAGN